MSELIINQFVGCTYLVPWNHIHLGPNPAMGMSTFEGVSSLLKSIVKHWTSV